MSNFKYDEIEDGDFELTDEQIAILEKSKQDFLSGKDKGKRWDEVVQEIRNKYS